LLFIVCRAVDVSDTQKQKKLIVYNIPRHSAIDVIVGTKYFFKGDSALQQNEILQKFHLQPCRLLHRVISPFTPGKLLSEKNFFRFGNTSFLLIEAPLDLAKFYPNTFVDIIILSHNPTIEIRQLASIFTCRQVVFDASNAAWKVAKWQQECTQLGLPAFSVADKGAFVFNLY
jgi:competence protein ComEC